MMESYMKVDDRGDGTNNLQFPEDFINKIICGDCLEILKKIPDNKINLLVTDPPYSIGTTSTGKKADWLDNNLIRPFFSIWFDEIKRILKDDGEFYINTDWRTLPFLYPIAETKLIVKNCIVWDFEWIKAGSHYRFSHEFIMYGIKNNNFKRKFSASERDVWRIKPINFTSGNKLHSAEKPVDLIKKMILNSTKENDLVLDTFAGSGSSFQACMETKRNYIGIEINPEYVKIANKRVMEYKDQLKLF